MLTNSNLIQVLEQKKTKKNILLDGFFEII